MTTTMNNLAQDGRMAVVGNAMIAELSGTPAEAYSVELVADGNDPAEGPAAVRLKRWLKMGLRHHGLRCRAVRGVAEPLTGHLAQTNAPGRWRPRGRAIRAAACELGRRGTSPQSSAGFGPDVRDTLGADRALDGAGAAGMSGGRP